MVKRSTILNDMGIQDRKVITFEERERWIADHEAKIVASAESPLTEPFWRKETSKPMQFLAFCLAYRQWKQDPRALIHLPIQIDGSCNGLQHIAALTGDRGLAQAVNVQPNDSGFPGDIYSELASAAAANLGQIRKSQTRKDAHHQQGLEWADSWLSASLNKDKWLNRGTAKKVVMTIPYGAGEGSQARYVLEEIAKDIKKALDENPTLDGLDELVDQWVKEKPERQKFVRECAKKQEFMAEETVNHSHGNGRRRKHLFPLANQQTAEQRDHDRLCVLAAYVSLAIVVHLGGALQEKYPRVKEFTRWLRRTADGCKGLPLLWSSPLGFPVCQNKFRISNTTITTYLGGKPLKIRVGRMDDGDVTDSKQQSSLLPNLIHSLDATHLAKTLLQANACGITDIGSIHDCLLCHPNDATTLSKIVRSTFAELYQPDQEGMPEVLMQWYQWMKLVSRISQLDSPNNVSGAWKVPNGEGEQGLGETDRGVLEDLRCLSSQSRQHAIFAQHLLRFLIDHPPKRKDGKVANIMPPPVASGLSLGDGDGVSSYFFS
ncbi:MAG: hypothetical protein HQL58_13720 [Magnetococcales bacterium]|nr:hypothetical protein [Magnetococcales bacterium]